MAQHTLVGPAYTDKTNRAALAGMDKPMTQHTLVGPAYMGKTKGATRWWDLLTWAKPMAQLTLFGNLPHFQSRFFTVFVDKPMIPYFADYPDMQTNQTLLSLHMA